MSDPLFREISTGRLRGVQGDASGRNRLLSPCRGLRLNGCAPRAATALSHLGRILPVLALFLLFPLQLTAAPAATLTCSRLPTVIEKLHASHYAMKQTTEATRTQAVDQMVKQLDPSRILFYEADLEKIRPALQGLFAGIQAGNCTPLQKVYDLTVARARENEVMVKRILGPDYKPDESAALNINVNKRPYAKSETDKLSLLKRIVQFQIENALLAGTELAEAKKQQIHRYELQTRRVIERDPEELVTSFAQAFALALDPHTNYLSAENMEDLQIQMQLSLEGIGAVLSSDNGFTTIEELIPGGGAERSGLLKPQDKIIAVAQDREKPLDVIDMDLRDIIKLIRGKKGTRVTLTILRQTERTERFDVTIVRDKIDIKEQEAKLTYETRTLNGRTYRFGVIDLPSFYGDEKEGKSCYEDVRNLLAEARRQRVDGMVLNLARNGGGLLNEAVRLAGLFIDRGGIVATRNSRGQVTVLANGTAAQAANGEKRRIIAFPPEDPRWLYSGPLVVLTSRLSASASEIVAGALQDYRRAVIVGSDHTFGKGSVQTLIPLSGDLGGIKVTTALFFLPGGKSTQKAGVAADVKLPGIYETDETGEAALDYALPAQSIPPFLGVPGIAAPLWKPVEPRQIASLAARSQARVAKDAKFIEILKNNKEAADRKDLIRLSDYRKQIEKEGGKKKESPQEQRQKARDQYAPFVNEGVNVLLDMVTQPPAPPQLTAAAAAGR